MDTPDIDILRWYMMGFNDELDHAWLYKKQDPPKKSEEDIHNTAYRMGASDAIVGDDVSSVDEKSTEQILEEIKECHEKNK